MKINREDIALTGDTEMLFVPVGDIHHNDLKRCDRSRLKRLMDWCERERDNGKVIRLIGMGDYLDTFSASERRALRGTLHESTEEWIERKTTEDLVELSEVLMPLRAHWIGFIEGNHTTIVKQSAEWLHDIFQKPNFGDSCMYQFRFSGTDLVFNVFAHHGRNTGSTWGSKIGARSRAHQVWPDAHLVCMGHDHAKFACPEVGLGMSSEGEMLQHKTYLIGTGSFLRGYTKWGSYVERGLYNPVDLGVVITTIKVEDRDGALRLDYHVSV